jgi:hypothetical protein
MLSLDRADKLKPEKRGENIPKRLKTSLTSQICDLSGSFFLGFLIYTRPFISSGRLKPPVTSVTS